MCNCSNISTCNQCQNGFPCNCPPDYSVTPLPGNCTCCPNGYTLYPPTPNYPNGYCQGPLASEVVAPGPCVDCDIAVPTDCVTYTGDLPISCNNGKGGNIYGINPGDTLTTIINKMCVLNKNVIEGILSAIGLDSDLGNAFCQLVQNCPSKGSGTVPVITSIIVTFP